MMKKLRFSIISIVTSTILAHASSDSALQAEQNIKYLNHKIASDYIFYCHNLKNYTLQSILKKDIIDLEESLRDIAKYTKDSSKKDVLNYLSYNKDQIKKLMQKEISDKEISTILDLNKALSEGIASISTSQDDTVTQLMNISKLYMADHKNKEEILTITQNIDDVLQDNPAWSTLKDILYTKDDYFVPNIVTILIKNLQKEYKTI